MNFNAQVNFGMAGSPARIERRRDSGNLPADLTIGYAKSNTSVCPKCDRAIMADEVRIFKRRRWHHLTCFERHRLEFGFFECGCVLQEFNALKKKDQKMVKQKLSAVKFEEPGMKRRMSIEDTADARSDERYRKQLKKELNTVSNNRNQFKKLTMDKLSKLLDENEQKIPGREDEALDKLEFTGQIKYLKSYKCEIKIKLVKEPTKKK